MKKNQQVCCLLASPPPFPPLKHAPLPSVISVLLPSPPPHPLHTRLLSYNSHTAAHDRQNRGKLPLPAGMFSLGWLGYHPLTPVGMSGVKRADKESGTHNARALHIATTATSASRCSDYDVARRCRSCPLVITSCGREGMITQPTKSEARQAQPTAWICKLKLSKLIVAPHCPIPTAQAAHWMHPCCRISIWFWISIWISIWISGAILQACMKVRFGRAPKHCVPTPPPPAANGEAKLYSPATGETPKRPRARLNERGQSAAVLADARLCWVASRVGRKQTRAVRGRAAAPTTVRSKSRVGGCVLGILFALAHTGTSVCQFKINGPNQCEGQGATEDDCPK